LQISDCWEESAQERLPSRNETLGSQGEEHEHYGILGLKTAHFGN